MVSIKSIKNNFFFFFFYFSLLGKTDMVLGKDVDILDWEWGRNSAPREGHCVVSWTMTH